MDGLPGVLRFRPLLRLGAAVVATGLSGCAPQNENDPNGLTVVNQSDVPMTVILVRPPLPEHQCRHRRADRRCRGSRSRRSGLPGVRAPGRHPETAVIELMFG